MSAAAVSGEDGDDRGGGGVFGAVLGVDPVDRGFQDLACRSGIADVDQAVGAACEEQAG